MPWNSWLSSPIESVDMIVTSPPYFRQRDYRGPHQIGQEATPAEYVQRLVDVFREGTPRAARPGDAVAGAR